MASLRAVSLVGALTQNAVPIYKCPLGSSATVVGASVVNTGGSNRVLNVYVHAPGDVSGRRVVRATLLAGAVDGNDFKLGDEHWLLSEGQSIEASQDAGTDLEYHFSILERT